MNRKFIVYIGLLFISLSTFSQEQDFEIWTEAKVEKILNKQISIIAVEEFRFDNNASTFDKWLNTIGVHYAINKAVRFRVLYRYTINNTLTKGFQKSNRIAADGVFRYKYERFIFRYRLRYQYDFINIDGLQSDGQFLRNRIGVKYNVPKIPLMPFINYELLHGLDGSDGVSLDRLRVTGGFSYDFTEYFTADIYFRHQSTNYSAARQEAYVLGFSVGFEF